MKKLFSFLIASICIYSASAQHASVGLRTGGSYWIDKENGKCVFNSSEYNNSWDKAIFIRYQTNGKIVLETAMGHYSLNKRPIMQQMECGNSGDYVTYLDARSQNFEWNLSAQYDITCPAMTSCPLMKHLKSYIGVVVTPTITRSTTELTSTKISDGSLTSSSQTNNELAIWTGLNHTLVYQINNEFYISSVLCMQMEPNKFFDKSGAAVSYDTRMGFQIGIGYNLK